VNSRESFELNTSQSQINATKTDREQVAERENDEDMDEVKFAVNRLVQGLTSSPYSNSNSRDASFLLTNSFLGAVSDTASVVIESNGSGKSSNSTMARNAGRKTGIRRLRSFNEYKAYSYNLADTDPVNERETERGIAEEEMQETEERESDISIATRGSSLSAVPMSADLRRVLGLPPIALSSKTLSVKSSEGEWKPPETWGLSNSEPIIKTVSLDRASLIRERDRERYRESSVAMSDELRRVLGFASASASASTAVKDMQRSRQESSRMMREMMTRVEEDDEIIDNAIDRETESARDGEDTESLADEETESRALEDIPMSAELRKLFGLPPLELDPVMREREWKAPPKPGLSNSKPILRSPVDRERVREKEEEEEREVAGEIERPPLEYVAMSENLRLVLGLPVSSKTQTQTQIFKSVRSSQGKERETTTVREIETGKSSTTTTWKPPAFPGLANSEPILRTSKNTVK
jgi:hypothetical protein